MAFTGNFTCDSFKTALLNGDVDFSGNTFKLALYTNSASLSASTTGYTADGEASGGDYVAGGLVLAPTVSSLDGVSFVSFSNVSWAGVITARGALIYKDGGTAVCVLDFGADKTSTTTFTVEFPANTNSSAIIRLN
jgi:hypothetical protein